MLIFSTVYSNSDINIKDKDVKSENVKPDLKDEESYANNLELSNEPYVLEPNLATEYHLTKSKQLFGRQFNAIKRETNDEALSIKQALLDQYSIADQIFSYYFEIDQDEDVFDRLVNYQHPVRKYEEALRKHRISRTKREVGEKLYTDSLNLESRWIKEAEKLQKDALIYLMDRESKENDAIIDKIRTELDKDLNEYKKRLDLNTKKLLQDQRRRNRDGLSNLRSKHSLNLKDFREKEKIRLQKARERIKEQRKKELEKLRLKQLKEKENELKKLREESIKRKIS